MSTPNKGGNAARKKAPAKKPSTFNEFWNKLLRRDKKKDAPTERTVKRAVSRVARTMHLKKKERQQVATVLAAEVQRQAQEKSHVRTSQMAPGDDAFPVPIQQGLLEQKRSSLTAPPEAESDGINLPPAAIEVQRTSMSDLEMQRKSFLEKSGALSTSAASGKSGRSGKGMIGGGSWSAKAYGSQPESITLEESAVKEISSHLWVNMFKDVLMQSVRETPNVKSPGDMTADELIEFRKSNPKGWDDYVKQTTVATYALSKPTADDANHAKKTKEKKTPRRPLQFDDKIDVVKAPVGRDFDPNEKRDHSESSLKRL